MRTTLVIGGLDPTGGAGITADARTLTAIGVHSMTVATAIVPQTLKEVRFVAPLDIDTIDAQLEAAFETVRVNSCKVSVIYSRKTLRGIVRHIARARSQGRFPVVFDPVLRATVGADLAGDTLPSIRELLRICDVITPNVNEAMALSKAVGLKATRLDAVGAGLLKLLDGDGLRIVVITDGSKGTDHVYRSSNGQVERTVLKGRAIKGKVHGSGCMHSSVIAGLLAKGYEVNDACALAKSFVEDVLRKTIEGLVGRPARNALPMILPPESRYDAAETVYDAAARLCELVPIEHLPEVGTNIAYSLPAPQGPEDVCALTSRIIRWEGRVRTFGRPAFGVESHMTRMALALARRRFDLRSCCNLKYSPDMLKLIKRAKLGNIEIDRTGEPPGKTTMDWIIENITDRQTGEDICIVYDTGMPGKEAMVRVLGRDPADVVAKVRRIFRETGRT